MKKKMLLSISALTISTTLLAGCGIRFGIESRENKRNIIDSFIDNVTNNDFDSNPNNSSSAIYNEDLHQSISTENVNKIDISILASEVTIKAIGGNEVTLDCTGSSNIVKETTYNKNNNTIYIQEKGSKSFNYTGINNSVSRKVIIGIPSSFEGDAIISCGAGEIIINDAIFKALDIKGGAGELTLSNIVFENLSLEQGIGETSINLNKKCGDMYISGGMGEFTLNLSEVGGNLTYSGGIGEATIDLPENAPVKLLTKAGLGETNISATTSGENTYTFDLSVGIGSLTVK
ncbi:MAG: DUF4097 family beta strand repeat-containing protein [Clostridium sp.]|nr:DUF4097 family beta strand repeat-containing protein [Clostridium sp.]MDU7082600.1 DUF4097 family beta strand repeat-containing protein [Clostridium sp.]